MTSFNVNVNELASNARNALERARRLALTSLGNKNSYFLGRNGEVVFSKNNVCVHEAAAGDGHSSDEDAVQHIPGYLTVRCQDDDQLGVTLVLQWLPNSTLERNPSSIRCISPTSRTERSRAEASPHNTPPTVGEAAQSCRDNELTHNAGLPAATSGKQTECGSQDDALAEPRRESARPTTLGEAAANRSLPHASLGIPAINLIPHTPVDPTSSDDEEGEVKSSTVKKSESSDSTSGADEGCDAEDVDSSPCDDESTAEDMSRFLKSRLSLEKCILGSSGSAIPEKFAEEHNLILKTDVDRSRQESARTMSQSNSLFSVNLGKMRSMRIFYSDSDSTSGQLVIASTDSQYKILHFHNGGLDKLAQLFENWNAIKAKSVQNGSPSALPDKQLLISQPKVKRSELDPEDAGLYDRVGPELWRSYMNEDGSIDDAFTLKKTIFFASMEPELRREIWPFLLRVYPWTSTHEQREAMRNDLFMEYQAITKQRIRKMCLPSSRELFAAIESSIMKDVVRTDRKNPFFAGDNNPNLETMRQTVQHCAMRWQTKAECLQGMSDLVGPVLSNVRDESLSYWCFAGLMEQSLFKAVPPGEKNAIERNLDYLRELLKLMLPDFYAYLSGLGDDALQLMFLHRWILLSFKREFPEPYSLHIWEACWSQYRTPYFHLFVCVAIVSIYGPDILGQLLPHDEILLYFAALTQHMNAEVVLKKARGLLHAFCRLPKIPCTLANICDYELREQWTSHITPHHSFECRGGHGEGQPCPYANE